jgi:hypothetical protein
VTEFRDEFLSEEDLDLQNLSEEELIAYWNLWLHQAQATNGVDAPFYSHGVFERDPAVDFPDTTPDSRSPQRPRSTEGQSSSK